MRYFIALEISEESKTQLKQVQDHLKKLIPDIRLTDNDKLHITIAFIGEQPESIQLKLTETMEKATLGISPFQLTPGYIDGFPNLHHPRIIWVGVKEDVDKLFLLRERIKDGLVDLNLEVDERRYTPHIAIAKSKDLQIPPHLESQLEEIMTQIDFKPIQVTSIKLYQSIPDHGFHSHNTLSQIPLVDKT